MSYDLSNYCNYYYLTESYSIYWYFHIVLQAGNSISLGTVLRNERILSKCLLGLTNGRRIVVQVCRVSTAYSIRTIQTFNTSFLQTYQSKELWSTFQWNSFHLILISSYPNLNASLYFVHILSPLSNPPSGSLIPRNHTPCRLGADCTTCNVLFFSWVTFSSCRPY